MKNIALYVFLSIAVISIVLIKKLDVQNTKLEIENRKISLEFKKIITVIHAKDTVDKIFTLPAETTITVTEYKDETK